MSCIVVTLVLASKRRFLNPLISCFTGNSTEGNNLRIVNDLLKVSLQTSLVWFKELLRIIEKIFLLASTQMIGRCDLYCLRIFVHQALAADVEVLLLEL